MPGIDAYWQNKSSPKALDLYLWAVLLGNTPLAMGLLPACQASRRPPKRNAHHSKVWLHTRHLTPGLPACQEPLRAGLIGARLCSLMAAALPLDVRELQVAAHKHGVSSCVCSCFPVPKPQQPNQCTQAAIPCTQAAAPRIPGGGTKARRFLRVAARRLLARR